ncbi:MAG TPA: ubiquitin-like domain-containing protein [Candidatus Saccharimonadales bacterium]|jgi:uncharacterized protein YabE (DUF348 family)|nr:ubiquitin-like domain-containing protein [Candidatus Saccharimonadales bacterium]
MRKRHKIIKKQRFSLPRFKSGRLKLFGRYPHITIPLVTFAVLILLSVMAIIWLTGGHPTALRQSDSRIVIVSHDKQKETVPTRAKTVGELLARLNIQLHTGDVVEPAKNTPIDQDDFRINVYRAVPVEIIDGATATYTFSAATTTRSIAEQAGFSLYPEDDLTLAPTTNFVSQDVIGQQLVINRSIPINLNLYGTQAVIRTHAKTVGDLIAEKHIKLAPGDTVQPGMDTPLTANGQIFLLHKGMQVVSEEQDIQMPVQTVQDSTLTSGTTAVRQQGSPGKQLVTYLLLPNGARQQIQLVVTQQPITQILAIGTAPRAQQLQAWLAALRQCESGGNYQDNTGNGFYGAYQFSQGTWDRIAIGRMGVPYSRADLAPPEVQDQAIIINTNASSGGLRTQNPGCYAKEGLSAFPPAN